jgi:Zn-dependent peptidase ImmA (M78 family)
VKEKKERCGLKTLTGVALTKADLLHPILGRIIFEPLEIQVFAQSDRGRERFTLAHELAHHLLRHGHYMSREYCDEEDFFLHRQGIADGTDIARMEFQANYFAGSLLMPRTNFVEDFWRIVRSLGISDRGFGALYVDNQPCNLQSYRFVTNQLMQGYGVSRSAATIRLESLGLLRDVRTAAKTVKSLLASVDASELPDTGPTGE